MCEYCRNDSRNKIFGKNIKMDTAGILNPVENANILKGEEDEKAYIVLYNNFYVLATFDIGYCPFCGRKL